MLFGDVEGRKFDFRVGVGIDDARHHGGATQVIQLGPGRDGNPATNCGDPILGDDDGGTVNHFAGWIHGEDADAGERDDALGRIEVVLDGSLGAFRGRAWDSRRVPGSGR